MTPERQRIVIAEMEGYTDLRRRTPNAHLSATKGDQPWAYVPDYLNDLAAARAMVARWVATHHLNSASEPFMGAFVNTLVAARGGWANTVLDLMLHATAAQWCEAFLKATRRWEETL